MKRSIDAVCSFLNPFAVETNDRLLIVSSEGAASDDIAADILNDEFIGQQARDEFIATWWLKTGRDLWTSETSQSQNFEWHEQTFEEKDNKKQKPSLQFKQQANIAVQ